MKKKKSRETHARVNESWRPMTRSKQGLPSLLLIKTMMIPVPLGVDLSPSLDFFMKKVHVLPESLATTSSYEEQHEASQGAVILSHGWKKMPEKRISLVSMKRERIVRKMMPDHMSLATSSSFTADSSCVTLAAGCLFLTQHTMSFMFSSWYSIPCFHCIWVGVMFLIFLGGEREGNYSLSLSLYICTSFSWRRKFVLTQQQWVLAWRSHDSFLISFHQTWFLVRWLFPSCLFRGKKRINKCLQRTRFQSKSSWRRGRRFLKQLKSPLLFQEMVSSSLITRDNQTHVILYSLNFQSHNELQASESNSLWRVL